MVLIGLLVALMGEMNRKKIVRIFLVAGLFVVIGSLAVVFSASATNILKSNAAIAVKSLRDAFTASAGSYLTAEIDISGDEAVQNASDTPDFASSSNLGVNDVSVDTSSTDTPSKKVKKKSTTAQLPSRAVSSLQETASGGEVSGSVSATPSKKTAPVSCGTFNTKNISHTVIVNEVAWMGSLPILGEAAAKATGREWMELKNNSAESLSLSGWQMTDASGNLKIVFDGGDDIAANDFFLLERGDEAISGMSADKTYSGALPNSGDAIFLFDDHCALADFFDASSGWTGGNDSTKQTSERDANGLGWHTSVPAGGTPKAENSTPVPQGILAVASDTLPTNPPGPSAQDHSVGVSLGGDGRGTVTSTPPGIMCGITCLWSFSAGRTVTLRATPDTASVFGGWSGACAGLDELCSFVITDSVPVAAVFNSTAAVLAPSPQAPPETPPPGVVTSTPEGSGSQTASGHLLIAAIQIAGASSTNDFVKLFNPTAGTVTISGWKLRKKASTGSDQSVREFPDGSAIPPNGYFVWANSAGGFSESIRADASSTATLAVANSAALFDASGTIVDAVAWGKGTDQYGEGSAYGVDPLPNQVLKRIFMDGVMMDTDDNANDFTI
jgi:hypothetical protein